MYCGTGHLIFSVSVSQISFRLCVLLPNWQSEMWFIGKMVLKVICEMIFLQYSTFIHVLAYFKKEFWRNTEPVAPSGISCSVVSNSVDPMDYTGRNTGVGKLFSSPGNLLNPGTEPRSPTLQVDSSPSEPPGKPSIIRTLNLKNLFHICDKLRYFPAPKHIPYWNNCTKRFSIQMVIHNHRHPNLFWSLLFFLICKL